MRKVLYLFILLGLLSFNAKAVYFPITSTGGIQVVGGVTVTVSGINSPLTGSTCGAGPYFIGGLKSDGYNYAFSTNVTHVRFEFVLLHPDDSVAFYINGSSTKYPLTAANVSAFAGTCGQLNFPAVNNSNLSALLTPGGTSVGATVDIQNATGISSVSVVHLFNSASSGGGTIYNAYLQNDTCRLDFHATVDSPACTNRTIKLHATQFPNTTYTWTGPAGYNATGSDPNLVIGPSPAAQAGKYIVTAIRGGCIFTDTIQNLFIDITPSKPLAQQAGPKCPGQEDTLTAQSTLGAGGTYHWYGPGSFKADTQQVILSNIQPSQAGKYYVYAISTYGCKTDTTLLDVFVNTAVTAKYSYTHDFDGCVGDTIRFTNQSVVDPTNPNNTFFWYFDDAAKTTATYFSLRDTMFVYPTRPKIDTLVKTYSVVLIVNNGVCSDTDTQRIDVLHPLFARFITDDTAICAHDSITFTNTSLFEDATVPSYYWRFGDGDTSDQVDVGHRYHKVGVYDLVGNDTMMMVITDYLGCKDTAYQTIIVDSTGAITFDVSDSTVCLGEVINFTGNYSPVGATNAIWDLGDGSTITEAPKVVHAYDKPGQYEVTFKATYRICPDTTFTRTVVVKPIPNVDLGKDTSICPNGQPIVLHELLAGALPGVTYRWNTSTKDSGSSIIVRHPGVYSVTATVDGCSAQDSVEIFKNCYIDIPNVFTPNGDGSNDYFLPRQFLSKDVTKFKMTIFDRWGVKVFETSSINGRGWDGKLNDKDQPTGVYIYMIEATFLNNTYEKYQGNITLLR